MENHRDTICTLQEGLDRLPVPHPNRADQLKRIAMEYNHIYSETQSTFDLDQVILYFQKALDNTPYSSPGRVMRLRDLGAGYIVKYMKQKVFGDLEKGTGFLEAALEAARANAPSNHADLGLILKDLGASFGQRYEHEDKQDAESIDKTIRYYSQSLAHFPPYHPHRNDVLAALSIAYRDKYRTRGENEDLKRSISVLQELLKRIPHDHPRRAFHLQSLGAQYRTLHDRSCDPMDLETALRYLTEALHLTPLDHTDRGGLMHDIGAVYFSKSQFTGATSDFDKAIQHLQEAVSMAPEPRPERPDRLLDLGGAYNRRSQTTGSLQDLNHAIDLYGQALKLVPENAYHRFRYLQNLGMAYRDKYRRTNALEDMRKHLNFFQEALAITPEGHPERVGIMQNLAAAYGIRYDTMKDDQDLEKAIELMKDTLETMPNDQLARPRAYKELGTGYAKQYQRTSSLEKLEQAIQSFQDALSTAAQAHPIRAEIFQDLGSVFELKFEKTGKPGDLNQAIPHYQNALSHTPSPANTRFRSGICLLRIYATRKEWPQATTAAAETVALIPLLTPRFLENSDKQYILIDLVGLASDAAAVALCAGHSPYEAVQLIEKGRGIIQGAMADIRADVMKLEVEHPSLAQQYTALRKRLDSSAMTVSDNIDDRYQVTRELEQLIRQVRDKPGFDGFPSDHSKDELCGAAKSGPIVIINVSRYRCDALIVDGTSLRNIPLDKLHIQDVQRFSLHPLAQLEVLEWLWVTVTEPVFKALNWTQPPSNDRWPHIWWIPTGPLARFPIHAAGNYSKMSTDTVLDRAISSYSTSIKAIIHGRTQRDRSNSPVSQKDIVLIAMEQTPRLRPLKFVSHEVNDLVDLFTPTQLHVSRPKPVQGDVLSALSRCKIFHFAGHGHTDRLNPLESALLLEDYEINSMTVSKLLENNLYDHRPYLAYLSACGTGQVKRSELADEGIHLIAACQLGGFQNVIGTLWEVDDRLCVDMAAETYRWIIEAEFSNDSVSEGLHHAIRRCRSRAFNASFGSRFTTGVVEDVLGVHQPEVSSANLDSRRDSEDLSMLRDSKPREIELFTSLLWVPYVHFGS